MRVIHYCDRLAHRHGPKSRTSSVRSAAHGGGSNAAGPRVRPVRQTAYAIVRDSSAEAQREVERITSLDPNAAGFASFDEWQSGTQNERELKSQVIQ